MGVLVCMSRYFRTQLVVKEIGPITFGFWAAGRPATEVIHVAATEIPYEVRELLTVGRIVHAKMQSVPLSQVPKFDCWESK